MLNVQDNFLNSIRKRLANCQPTIFFLRSQFFMKTLQRSCACAETIFRKSQKVLYHSTLLYRNGNVKFFFSLPKRIFDTPIFSGEVGGGYGEGGTWSAFDMLLAVVEMSLYCWPHNICHSTTTTQTNKEIDQQRTLFFLQS